MRTYASSWPPTDLKPLPVLIGHRWTNHDEYSRLVDLLNERMLSGVEWVNLSVPRTNPIQTDGTPVDLEDKLTELLWLLKASGGALVVAARVGITYSEACKFEIRTARAIGLPIVAALPLGERGSTFAIERASAVVGWRGDSVVEAVCKLTGRTDILRRINVREAYRRQLTLPQRTYYQSQPSRFGDFR